MFIFWFNVIVCYSFISPFSIRVFPLIFTVALNMVTSWWVVASFLPPISLLYPTAIDTAPSAIMSNMV